MAIIKPYTFVAGNKARANEVNADFDILYQQVNANITDIAENASDIESLDSSKADINGSATQRFAVADAISSGDAVNKQTLFKQIGNSIDYISGLTIEKDSGSPDDTILVNPGSAYDSTQSIVLSLDNITSKQNGTQAASATYYVYIIGNSTGSTTDILISTESITPTLPSGYTLYRKIGSYTTNSNNEIDSISYYGTTIDGNNSGYGITSLMIPDYSAGIGIGNGHVCTTNGFISAHLEGVYNNGFQGLLYINSTQIATTQSSGGYVDSTNVTALVGKGDVVSFSHGYCTFYPLRGVE